MEKKYSPRVSLDNPFKHNREVEFSVPGQASYEPGLYEQNLQEEYELIQRPKKSAGERNIQRQHAKKRMTIWERLDVLADSGTEPTILFQNWGPNLDGASLVTAIVTINDSPIDIVLTSMYIE